MNKGGDRGSILEEKIELRIREEESYNNMSLRCCFLVLVVQILEFG
jgi:hypothetical protein